MAFLIALLVFISLVTVIVGVWWARLPGRRIDDRIGGAVAAETWDQPLLKPEQVSRFATSCEATQACDLPGTS